MRPYLLDVNVLLSLAWPPHVHHLQSTAWFRAKRPAGFATCAITQIGFIRISSNPKLMSEAARPQDAAELLKRLCSLPGHQFWADALDWQAVEEFVPAVYGHRQVTDAHLLALAASNGGILATLDRGVLSLAGDHRFTVELVSQETNS